jgi:hypothetical protein
MGCVAQAAAALYFISKVFVFAAVILGPPFNITTYFVCFLRVY